jgi:hypothetical protein
VSDEQPQGTDQSDRRRIIVEYPLVTSDDGYAYVKVPQASEFIHAGILNAHDGPFLAFAMFEDDYEQSKVQPDDPSLDTWKFALVRPGEPMTIGDGEMHHVVGHYSEPMGRQSVYVAIVADVAAINVDFIFREGEDDDDDGDIPSVGWLPSHRGR